MKTIVNQPPKPQISLFGLAAIASVLWLSTSNLEAVPGIINYQGKISEDGVIFDGTGEFKFAFVNFGEGTSSVWSNDGTSVDGMEPTASVSLPVSRGNFSVGLGDTNLAGMTDPISPSIFSDDNNVFLRVWFSATGSGFQLLTPDLRIVSEGFAFAADRAASAGNADTLEGSPASGFFDKATHDSANSNGIIDNADFATNAGNADTADVALEADSAIFAIDADNAVNAEFSTDAGNAATADDADFLDGIDSAGFSPAIHDHDGEDITFGTVGDNFLSPNVALQDAPNIFSAPTNTFSGFDMILGVNGGFSLIMPDNSAMGEGADFSIEGQNADPGATGDLNGGNIDLFPGFGINGGVKGSIGLFGNTSVLGGNLSVEGTINGSLGTLTGTVDDTNLSANVALQSVDNDFVGDNNSFSGLGLGLGSDELFSLQRPDHSTGAGTDLFIGGQNAFGGSLGAVDGGDIVLQPGFGDGFLLSGSNGKVRLEGNTDVTGNLQIGGNITGGITVTTDDSFGNFIFDSLVLEHTNNAGNGANGIGAGIVFRLEDSGGEVEDAVILAGEYTNAVDGLEESAFKVFTRPRGDGPTEALNLSSTGNLTVNSVTADTLESTVVGPNPPLVVSSIERVLNLNADFLDDLDSSDFAPVSHFHLDTDLPTNVAYQDLDNDFSGTNTFSGTDLFLGDDGPFTLQRPGNSADDGTDLIINGQSAFDDLSTSYMGGSVFIQPGLGVNGGSNGLISLGGATEIHGDLFIFGNVTGSGGIFSGDGSGLTNLDATNLAGGTVPDLRLSTNVPLLDAMNNFTAANTFSATNMTVGGDADFTLQRPESSSGTGSTFAIQGQNAAPSPGPDIDGGDIDLNPGAGTGSPNVGVDGSINLNGNTNVSGDLAVSGKLVAANGVELVRTIIVGPDSSGGVTDNGANLLAAITSLSTLATSTTPYLIKIEPGTYDLNGGNLSVPDYVDIEGSGRGITTIRSSISGDFATVLFSGLGHSAMRHLKVINTGGSRAIEIFSSTVYLFEVDAYSMSGSDANNVAIKIHTNSYVDMCKITASATGAIPVGMVIDASQVDILDSHVDAICSSLTDAVGMSIINSSQAELTNVLIIAQDGSVSNIALSVDSLSFVIFKDGEVSASTIGGVGVEMVAAGGATIIIINSIITGSTESILHNDEIVKVVTSQLSFPLVIVIGQHQVTQTFCYDDLFQPLPNLFPNM